MNTASIQQIFNANLFSALFAIILLLSFVTGFWAREAKQIAYSGLDVLRGLVPPETLGITDLSRLLVAVVPIAALTALTLLIVSILTSRIRQSLPVMLSACGGVALLGCIAYLLQTTPNPSLNRVLDYGFWLSIIGAFGLGMQVFFNRTHNVPLRTRFTILAGLTGLNAVVYLLTLYAEVARSRQNESVAFEITSMIGLSLYGAVVGMFLTGYIFRRKGYNARLGRLVGLIVGAFGHLFLLIPLWIYTPYRQHAMRNRIKIDEIAWGMVMLAPWLVGFILLTVYPMLDSYRVALYNWQGIGQPTQYVGLRHIENVIRDPIFWGSLRNTITYTVILVPIQLSLALLLALILTRKEMRFAVFYRAIYFMPVVTSVAVVAVVMRLLLGNFGTSISELFNIRPAVNPIASPQLALPSVIVFGIWHSFGVNLVNFIAALQTVPEELYDAAKVDGANWFEQVLHVTLPSIRPISIMIAFIAIIGSMYVFEQSFVLTRGGPYFASQVVTGYIYNYAFRQPGTQLTPNFGYASSAALFYAMLMLGITVANYWVTNRIRKNES